jgi:hypothetical protein
MLGTADGNDRRLKKGSICLVQWHGHYHSGAATTTETIDNMVSTDAKACISTGARRVLNTTGSSVTTLLASSPTSKVPDQTKIWIAGVSAATPKTPLVRTCDLRALFMPYSA